MKVEHLEITPKWPPTLEGWRAPSHSLSNSFDFEKKEEKKKKENFGKKKEKREEKETPRVALRKLKASLKPTVAEALCSSSQAFSYLPPKETGCGCACFVLETRISVVSSFRNLSDDNLGTDRSAFWKSRRETRARRVRALPIVPNVWTLVKDHSLKIRVGIFQLNSVVGRCEVRGALLR